MKKLLSLIFVLCAVGGMHFTITTESLLNTELTTLALVQNWMTPLVTKGKPGNSEYINYNTLNDEVASAIKNLSPQQKIKLAQKAANAKTIFKRESALILNIKAGLDAIAALCKPEGEVVAGDDAPPAVVYDAAPEAGSGDAAGSVEGAAGSVEGAAGEEDVNLEEGAPESLVPEDASSSPAHREEVEQSNLENGDDHSDEEILDEEQPPLFDNVAEPALVVDDASSSPEHREEVVPVAEVMLIPAVGEGAEIKTEEPVTPAPVTHLPYKIPHKDTGRSELTEDDAAKRIQAVIRARTGVSKPKIEESAPAKKDKPSFRAQGETLHESKVSCTLKTPAPAQNHNLRNALVVAGVVFVALAAYVKRSTIASWFKQTSSSEEPAGAPDAAPSDSTEPANSAPSADVTPATAEQPATPAENADSTPANSEAQPIA